jgi:hypothetical protein
MTTVEALRKARDLIEDPNRWTTGAFARDARGVPIDACNEGARYWCALGALRRYCPFGNPEGRRAHQLLEEASGDILDSFNDTSTHAEVLTAFDRAIELAERDTTG